MSRLSSRIYNESTPDLSELSSKSSVLYTGRCYNKECTITWTTKTQFDARSGKDVTTTYSKEKLNGVIRYKITGGEEFKRCPKCKQELVWKAGRNK
jgi:hypothetical protein